MIRREPIDASASNTRIQQLSFALALTLICAISAAAQQPANRQRSPRLTTDDVARQPVAPTPVEAKNAAKPEDGKPGAAEAKSAEGKPAETKSSPEETEWRDRINKARKHTKELERAAEEAELRVTALRNELAASGGSAKHRNETAAEMDDSGQRLVVARSQARAAADDLAQLVEYGTQKGFTEAAEPKAVEEGKPNEQYYRTQFMKLSEALDSAQRRIQLYENRVRDLNQQLSSNGAGKDKAGRRTGGDSFYAAQLIKDRDEAQEKLDTSRTALTKAQTDLDNLKDEARRAGVPPGLFR